MHSQLDAEGDRARGDRLLEALQASERTLRESEERYRLLWQTTTDAVLIIDDQGLIQFANPALERLFGHRPDEVIGGPLGLLQPERLRGAHEPLTRFIGSHPCRVMQG